MSRVNALSSQFTVLTLPVEKQEKHLPVKPVPLTPKWLFPEQVKENNRQRKQPLK